MDQPSEACPLPPAGDDARIREILSRPLTVAVVGMSPKTDRPSYEVGMYLHEHGFRILPVHPAAERIGGLPVYKDLESLPEGVRVDLVDLFVAGARVMPVVEQAAKIGAPIIWFQPGTENDEAQARAAELGMEVIAGRCTMADHRRLVDGT